MKHNSGCRPKGGSQWLSQLCEPNIAIICGPANSAVSGGQKKSGAPVVGRPAVGFVFIVRR